MIGSYLTDSIVISSNSYDINGARTGSDTAVSARVEDFNEMINSMTGNEVLANMKVVFKNDVDIAYNDTIKIVTKAGNAYQQPDKNWQIKKISKMYMFDEGYTEVVI
jgi:hypothetical protein